MARPVPKLAETAAALLGHLQTEVPALVLAEGLDAILTWTVGHPIKLLQDGTIVPIIGVDYVGMGSAGLDVDHTSIGGGQRYIYRMQIFVLLKAKGTTAQQANAARYAALIKEVLDDHVDDATVPYCRGLVSGGVVMTFYTPGGKSMLADGALWNWDARSPIS